jgi:uncharacterized membrane protein
LCAKAAAEPSAAGKGFSSYRDLPYLTVMRPLRSFQVEPPLMSMLRIAAMNDGVLALAITLLVFNCELPGLPAAHVHDDLPTIGKGLGTYLLSHALSFAIIGVCWASDHSLPDHIRRSDAFCSSSICCF